MSRIYGVNANRTDINKTEYLKLAGNCKENKIQGGNCPMKKSRSFIHYGKVLLIFAIFMLVPFTGCKNIFVPEPPATPEAAGSGGGITVTLRLFTGSARTVMPEYTKTGSLNWKIIASQGETAVEASGAYPDYTLSLPSAGSWTFTVSGNNSDGQEIFTGSVSMEITGTTATVSIPLSPGSAMTEGTGKIRLTLTVPDTVKEVMYKLDTDEAFRGLTPGSDNTCTLEKESIPAGTHTLSLYFLDGDGTTLYICKETVNVWGGMTSDQWINTGNSAYINGEGEFELTEDIITAFLKTMGSVVYVDGDSGSDDSDGVGSIFAPVASVSKAVEILRKANTKANYSATIMVSGETTIDQEIEVNSGETLTVKGTGENASITNDKGRVFNITGGSLTLGDGITLTGTVTGDNGGAVYVAGGAFTMESGSTIADSSVRGDDTSGGGVYVGGDSLGSSTFTMRGGTIDGAGVSTNAESGGGVEIYNATFTMEGGTITGNNAMHGGGVRMDSGEFIMKDGTISDNNATILGGGVCVINGSFTMEGGTIGGTDAGSANTADYGGGVYMNGSFTVRGGTIQGQDNKNEIYSCKTFTITGEPIIIDCTVILANDLVYINVDGLNENAALTNVRVNPHNNNYTEGTTLLENAGSKDICDKFALNNIPKDNGIWWIGLDDSTKNGILCNISDVNDLKSLVTAAGSGGKVEITGGGDIVVDTTVSVPDGADVTIKPGSGYSVNITASGETTVFDVQAGGSLTLGGGGGTVVVEGDSTASNPTSVEDAVPLVNVSNGGTVTIVDNTYIQNNKAGNGVKVTDGTLIMTGGHITGNTGLYSCGGGVYVSGSTATFEMSGGEISGHDLQLGGGLRQGAGVHVSNGAIFILSGDAEIHDNKAQDGAAVYLINDSKFYMKGGKIYDNYAYDAVGAVYIRAQNIQSAMYMTGGSITNNIAAQSSHAGGIFIENGTFDGTGAKSASITGNKKGGQSGSDKDISMNSYSTYTIGNVTVGVGP